MGLPEVVHPKVRLPWSLRGKIDISQLQLVGQNARGVPYIQGQIRNRSSRPLRLKILVEVLNDLHKPIFSGSPSILETFDLDAQQQRAFRISLKETAKNGNLDCQRLWVTRSEVQIKIEA